MKRLVPLFLLALSAACADSDVPSLPGRTPSLPTPTPTALGAVSGQVEFVVEARLIPDGDSGTFTMTGAITDSGVSISRHSSDGDRLVMERELRGTHGTIFVHMEGSTVPAGQPVDFTWVISGATNGYEGLTGNGTGTDTFPTSTAVRGQFTGQVGK